MKKSNQLLSIILPNKKTNIFIISLIILGITIGSLYASMLNINDQALVIDKIKSFITNINNASISSLNLFKNSLIINLLYVITIWIFGLTLCGSIIAIILLLIKNFILGFSIASFIITYSYKGLLLSFLYLIFGELTNILVILLITTYTITYTINIIKKYLKQHNHNYNFLKPYSIILLISLILSLISAVSNSFLLPPIIKLIVKLYL